MGLGFWVLARNRGSFRAKTQLPKPNELSGGRVRAASPRARDVLRFVAQSIEELGYPPTVREIADHFGWSSTHAATCHLVSLEKRKLIVRTPLASRGLFITNAGRELIGAPRRAMLDSSAPSSTPFEVRFVPTGLAFAAELAVEALDLAS